jgi:spermidine dehydrogenase
MVERKDRQLGMDRPIERRDFLNGVALGVAGVLAAPHRLWPEALKDPAPEKAPGYYPPALTGLRGSHEGAYEAAHALRDGSFWESAGAPEETGESYDLVVVGGGISGLAAAHFFRKQAGPRARILILDNHDDLGGHAKRNEFQQAGRLLIGYGGTFAIDSPAPYSAVAQALVRELGIDVSRSRRLLDRGLYPGLGLRPAIFFDAETFGADRLLPDPGRTMGGEDDDTGARGADPWPRFLAEAPLAETARRDIARLYRERVDYLPGLSSAEKKARLARISYADFLVQLARADRGVLPFFQARTHPLYGVGIDAVPAQDAWGLGFPGFAGLGLDPAPGRGMNRDSIPNEQAEGYFFHFPDGNASVARLLLRSLLPAAVPGHSADDVVTARLDYARLDDAGPVRVRLNSTVVRVRHRGEPAAARDVEVVYARQGALHAVRASRVVLACWHTVIPHLCPELPEAQKEALAYAVKVPIVYTNVVVRSWTSFRKLGVRSVHAPGSFHSTVNLDLPVSIGGYRCPRTPGEPIVLHLMRTPCRPGLPARDQHRAGRGELLSTPFAVFERQTRDELARILGAGGFDPARDIAAVTVNPWPHGYAYQYNSLWDPFWLEGGEAPCLRARRRFGRIAIANADAAAYAYTDAAIDEAHRAVGELSGEAP